MAAFAGTKFKYQELAYQRVGLLLFLKISAAIQTSVAKFFRIRINGLKTSSNWYGRPNPEDRINRKRRTEFFDRRIE